MVTVFQGNDGRNVGFHATKGSGVVNDVAVAVAVALDHSVTIAWWKSIGGGCGSSCLNSRWMFLEGPLELQKSARCVMIVRLALLPAKSSLGDDAISSTILSLRSMFPPVCEDIAAVHRSPTRKHFQIGFARNS